jgi:hypothetical protein
MDMDWTPAMVSAAKTIAMQRFAANCVARQMISPTYVDSTARTVPRNRFDFGQRLVVDTETVNLYEPFAECQFTLAQLEEFSNMLSTQGGATMPSPMMMMQSKACTSVGRNASDLARFHDAFFFGTPNPEDLPPGVSPGKAVTQDLPKSLRDEAISAEHDLPKENGPILVSDPLNESLVAAAFAGVLRLETRGYYSMYHMVLGETLWEELHRPTAGSVSVLPADRIKDRITGGFFVTTTLPPDEALILSIDGPTIEHVVAGSEDNYPTFLLLPTQLEDGETIYRARIRGCFAPRVRENRSIVRLLIQKSS